VEGGDKIRFWEDFWCGGGSLLSKYPRMFSLSLDQGKKVVEVGGWEDSEWRWRLRWRRVRFQWEEEQEEEMYQYISTIRFSKEVNDAQVWGGDALGEFLVRSVYGSLKQNLVWKGMWAAIVWCIWDQRNHIAFRQGKVDAEEIFQMAQLKTWLWMKHRMNVFNYSFSDWHLNPLICIKSVLRKEGLAPVCRV